nr:hypothetical protein [uncultured Cohaesibacter sp.]
MVIKDGDWELVKWDGSTGRTVWRYCDGRATHYRTDYPVQSILDANAGHLNDSQNQRFGDGKRVASIPLNLFYEQLHEAQLQGDGEYISRWLNDPDHRGFRTFRGHI